MPEDTTSVTYNTLVGKGHARLSVKGSTFIARAAPVDSVDAATAVITNVKEAHESATHHVPAYRVRIGNSPPSNGMLREYYSDDGEPSGTAGKPALNVLQGKSLENATVVVTRQYGGTDLGTGGLVRAYSRVTSEAVRDAGIVEKEPRASVVATVTYDDSGTVRSILESESVDFEADYAEQVTFEIRVPMTEAGTLRDRLRSATHGRVDLEG